MFNSVQSSRPVAKFTEDFDFIAMNEKFNKDEVWGHLGKISNPEDGEMSDEDDIQTEDVASPSKPDAKVRPATIYAWF